MDSNKNSFIELINELIAKIKALFSDDKPNEQNNPNDAEELIAGASAPIITASVMAPGDDGSSSGSPQSVNTPGPLDSGNDVAASHNEEGLLSEHSNSPSNQNVFLPPLKSTTTLAPEIIPDTITNLDLSDPSQAARYTKIQVKNGSGTTIQSSILGVGNVRTGLDDLAIGSPTESTLYIVYGKTGGLGETLNINTGTYPPNPINSTSGGEKRTFAGERFGEEIFSMPNDRILSGSPESHAQFMVTSPDFSSTPSHISGRVITGRDFPTPLANTLFSITSLPVGDSLRSGVQNFLQKDFIGTTTLSDSTGSIGDLNKDGYGDMFLRDRDPNAGTAYIVYGNKDLDIINGQFISDAINDNPKTTFINLGTASHHKTLSYIGNLNGTGDKYIAITSPVENKATIIMGANHLGMDGLKGLTIDTNNLNSGALQTLSITTDSTTQKITGSYVIGDTNGDGIVDMAVTTSDGTVGSVFIIYGQNQTWSAGKIINIDHLSTDEGYKIAGAPADSIIIPARDINGDLMSDFIISSPSTYKNLLLYGFDNNLENNDAIVMGDLNNNTLVQQSQTTTLLGGAGNDTLQINHLSGLVKVDGGLGNNTLILDENLNLDLTNFKNNVFENIQTIHLSGNNDLTIGLKDILDLNTTRSNLDDSDVLVSLQRSLIITNTGPSDTSSTVTVKLDDGVTHSSFTGATHHAYLFNIPGLGDNASMSLIVDHGITVSFSGEPIT